MNMNQAEDLSFVAFISATPLIAYKHDFEALLCSKYMRLLLETEISVKLVTALTDLFSQST